MKPLDEILPSEFRHYPGGGKIIAGIRHRIRTRQFGLEKHECYQFDSFAHVISTAKDMSKIPGMERVEVVTHRGAYKGIKVLGVWQLPPPAPGQPIIYHE